MEQKSYLEKSYTTTANFDGKEWEMTNIADEYCRFPDGREFENQFMSSKKGENYRQLITDLLDEFMDRLEKIGGSLLYELPDFNIEDAKKYLLNEPTNQDNDIQAE